MSKDNGELLECLEAVKYVVEEMIRDRTEEKGDSVEQEEPVAGSSALSDRVRHLEYDVGKLWKRSDIWVGLMARIKKVEEDVRELKSNRRYMEGWGEGIDGKLKDLSRETESLGKRLDIYGRGQRTTNDKVQALVRWTDFEKGYGAGEESGDE